ncbi:putative 3-hydroxyacyl- nad binding protein [Botrytis fragariae]|uniref:Putative 3-hydroxyacyl- nad binding protein n=1 Tax=Botrytis fragariae TaxID=1964551 RepID=A0A8H6B210_9HELO|nr:putative 3-hydroxyacyl- nad binding protein [Botrytis fragariae]KAF5877881.1 putative 3-hydroxyacyl- nad binding protein [Botrytis fragariae]
MTFTLPTTKNRPITVLGGGVLGRRIACTWASGGWDVRIRDPSLEQRNAALHYIENNISIYASAIQCSSPGTVTAHEDLAEAVKGAWNVIEAVPEKLQLKIDTFAELEKLCESDTLLVSNSSSYKTSEMLEKVGGDTRKRIFNTHYMMPPDNKIVELMTDGETADEIFPWYVERLKEVGMHPIVAKRESTGFVFNRVWASIKRECLMILAEGVSTPEELDRVWVEMFGKRYLEEGKLGAKSGKGGLYPPGQTTKVKGEEKDHHENLHAPSLYMLDIGLNSLTDTLNAGRIVVGSPDGRQLRTLVSGQHLPDGLDISLKTGRIYWTCMGIPTSNDGTVQSCQLDGSDIRTVIPSGAVHTPKQLIIDHAASKLYLCDREGLRVMRCNFDGSEHETIIQTGDWKIQKMQKINSNGGKGRIFRANIQMPAGQNASTRKDIELLFQELPEPIDLEIDEDTQTLYWTDRGDPPRGNSLNAAKLGDNSLKALKDDSEEKNEYQILTRQLHEAIGLKLDTVNKHVYLTDLGGAVYRVGMDGKDKKRVYDEECSFTGVGLAHV